MEMNKCLVCVVDLRIVGSCCVTRQSEEVTSGDKVV